MNGLTAERSSYPAVSRTVITRALSQNVPETQLVIGPLGARVSYGDEIADET